VRKNHLHGLGSSIGFDYASSMEAPPTPFLDACKERSIDLSPDALEQLSMFVTLFLKVNQRMNLSAVRDAEGVWMRHVFDSLLLLPFLKADPDQHALDLGSGGGFPGLVLAIVRPDMGWTLVDSVGKKARFLEETSTALGLTNTRALSDRAEVLGQSEDHRELYTLVTARAVARLPVLLELTVPLLKVGGHLLAMKGEQADLELKEAKRAIDVLHVSLKRRTEQPGGGILLDFRKNRPTSHHYPRAVGVPGQKPL
jgi:16S rRNA (guanine527-N7)-methyltransferase